MIIEFSFSNFKSFQEINSLNMTSAKVSGMRNIGITDDKHSLLKSKAIYGANASGKSNLIKALVVFLKIIKNSVKNIQVIELVDSYRLSQETEKSPTFFQLIFNIEDRTYRYGFEASNQRISGEWLFVEIDNNEIPFFIRENNDIIEISEEYFTEGTKRLSLFEDDADDNLLDDKSLFLTTIASLKGKISQKIINYLESIIVVSGLKDFHLHEVAKKFLEKDNNRKKILQLLKLADTGIDNIKLVELSEHNLPKTLGNQVVNDLSGEKIIISEHKKYNNANQITDKEFFSFSTDESEGTIKIFELSPLILLSLSQGSPIIIDEFDARFHPLISKKLVELFNSPDNKTAQLIFVTHDTNLLSANLLRQDQIDFVEKDKYGASHIYTLVQFKGVQQSSSIEKDYIAGKYGAIPFLGDFEQIIKTENDA